MYLLLSTLVDDGNAVLDLNMQKVFVSDNSLTNLNEDMLEENDGYKLLQKFNQYIFSLRFHPEKRNEIIEDYFLLQFSLIPLDIYVLKELIEIAFSDNPNLSNTKESVSSFLHKQFSDLMDSLDFLRENSYDNTISFECALVEDEVIENNSGFVVCGYAVDYGGRGPDNDFSVLKPIVISHSSLSDAFMELLDEAEGEINYTWLSDFQDNYGKIEELDEIYEDSQRYDVVYLKKFEAQ